MLSHFPRDVLDDILNLIESVSEGFPTYSRKDTLNVLKQKKYSIYFLQDTHFTKKRENYIRSQLAFECFFFSHTLQSRGVAIFF